MKAKIYQGALLSLLLTATAVPAADMWIVEGLASTTVDACKGVRWEAKAILHNRSSSDKEVRRLHTSNSSLPPQHVQTAVLPAATSVSARSLGVGGSANAHLWVTRLDVPQGVWPEGRLEYFSSNCSPPGHPPNLVPSGKLALPVFRSLASPNTEQLHLGTDLGVQAVRMNVAIYNASPVTAVAEVELHRPACETSDPVQERVMVPPDSIIQVLLPNATGCTGNLWVPSYVSFVTVKVDQPSFSFVSTLGNGSLPFASVAVGSPE